MSILDFNASWMIYNSFLAFIAIVFGYIFMRVNNTFFKALFGLVWLLFLPNTIYIFTDLVHLTYQWSLVHAWLRIPLIMQYIFLESAGITSFLLAFLPFEKIIRMVKLFREHTTLSLVLFNFLIAFGMVLGRVERINSWEVFTRPKDVFISAINVLTSFELLGLTILFGLLCNFLYFLLRDWLLTQSGKSPWIDKS